jgi:hypothetical protein
MRATLPSCISARAPETAARDRAIWAGKLQLLAASRDLVMSCGNAFALYVLGSALTADPSGVRLIR